MEAPEAAETPHGKLGLVFAKLLVSYKFEKAQQMLAPSLRREYPASKLKKYYEEMISYAGNTTAELVKVVGTMEDWDDKEPKDVGWAYVSISGPFEDPPNAIWNEAVAIVATDIDGQLLISELVWGRP